MIAYFAELAQAVRTRWARVGHDDVALTSIAQEELERRPPSEHVTFADVMDHALFDVLGPQRLDGSNSFGQPPISVYEDDMLAIQVLPWLDGTTSVHEHTFTGAFSVLEGSSLHARYRFDEHRSFGDRLAWGSLSLDAVEVLRPGVVRPIHPGRGALHALFHLDHPSATVVVRSMELARGIPQLSHYSPGLGVDGLFNPPLLRRRLLMLATAAKVAPDDLERRMLRFVEDHGPLAAVRAIMTVDSVLGSSRALKPVIARTAELYGNELAGLAVVLEEERRKTNLISRRASIEDNEHRFFLALLLNVPSREEILRLVEAEYGGDSVAHVLRWIDAIERAADGKDGAEAGLGVALGPAERFVLEGLLRGQPEAQMVEQARSGVGPAGITPASVQKALFVLPHTRAYRTLLASGA